MAFEQNLEADRVDGFNIFSAFVRVPLLVLGGILGGDGSSAPMNIDSDAPTSLSSNHNNKTDAVTNIGDDSSSTGDHSDGTKRLDSRQPSDTALHHFIHRKPAESAADHIATKPGILKRTRKMSWSDESGLPLVYEHDESVSHHDPTSNPYSSANGNLHKPTKSAMRKSRSIREVSDRLVQNDGNNSINMGRSRYIPNMNPRIAGNGFILPTRPYGGHSSVDGKAPGPNSADMSPQWGWYINTTPPTPELYHSRTSSLSTIDNSSHKLTKGVTQSGKPVAKTAAADGQSCQNQVFQNLKNSTKSNPMGGWTSIPI